MQAISRGVASADSAQRLITDRAIVSVMPIGDPHGTKNFEYTTEGLPETIFLASVPISDLGQAIRFYRDILHMEVVCQLAEEAYVRRETAVLRLYRCPDVGINTGVYLGVHDPYEFHRRMIDEGVRFRKDPYRTPLGMCTSFLDSDGNTLFAIERGGVSGIDVKTSAGDDRA